MSTSQVNNNIVRGFNNRINGFVNIGEDINEAVNGNLFNLTISGTLASTAHFDIGIVTPANCDIRVLGMELGADINFLDAVLYEDVAFTGNATLDLLNANRQSSTTSDILVYSTFTVAGNPSGKVELDRVATFGGAGVGGTSTGGSQKGAGFFVLNKSTNYLIRVTNQDTGTANYIFKLAMIETNLND